MAHGTDAVEAVRNDVCVLHVAEDVVDLRIEVLGLAVMRERMEQVEHANAFAAFDELVDHMRSDEAAPAGDENRARHC